MSCQSLERRYQQGLMFIIVVCVVGGCSSYVAPGKAARLDLFTQGATANPNDAIDDYSIRRIIDRSPASPLPVRLVMVRVQSPDYQSYTVRDTCGTGNYSIVTVRDVEEEKDYERIRLLPQVAYVGTMNRLLIRESLNNDRELRLAAAPLQPDMLLIYTIETIFTSEDDATPLSVISLGLSPTVNVHMTSTASALLMDSRTGYIYGAAESSDKRKQLTSWWTSQNTIDQSRRITERAAFEKLIGEFETLWPDVVRLRQVALRR